MLGKFGDMMGKLQEMNLPAGRQGRGPTRSKQN